LRGDCAEATSLHHAAPRRGRLVQNPEEKLHHACFCDRGAPAIAKDDKSVDPDKKVCRRTEATGSIIGGKRQCHTRAEWKSIDDANSEAAQRFSDRRSSTGH
jgi:hypothetical protein